MSTKLKPVIFTYLGIVYFQKDDSLFLTIGIIDFLTCPYGIFGMLGIHKKKDHSLVNGINDDIDKLTVTFNPYQIYPTASIT